MNRRVLLLMVASAALIFSCKPKSDTSESTWKEVYKNAYTNHDYTTAVVALNQLLVLDTANKADYYDSLAFYNFKKLVNYDAAQKYTDQGLLMNPDNALLLEYKSYYLGMENKIEDAMSCILKAYKISGLNKHKYLYASMKVAQDKDIPAFMNTVNEILYNNPKREFYEVNVDANTTQLVDLRASCYLDKAKIAMTNNDANATMIYLDSSLSLSPNFQEALYYKNELTKGKGK